MRITELLTEKAVQSTWITDLVYNRPNKRLTMRVSDGKTYSITGLTRTAFEKWVKAESKGQYFHNFIKDRYNVVRIK